MNAFPHISRRRFLQSAAVATATLPRWFESEAATTPRRLGPNEQPAVALVGCGGMGRGDARNAARFGRIVALCDVDTARLEQAKKDFPEAATFSDFRKIMERDDIHVVICGTVDHWHTLVSLAAMNSGKDVYCEKPLTLTIDEGKRLVRTAKRTGRILQTGSQQRSDKRFRLAVELVRNGRLGRLRRVTTVLPEGLRGGPFPSAPVPAGLDWDFWKGPTPDVAYVKERCHFSFRYWFEYSGGTMTDWGAHHNDIALWAIAPEHNGPTGVYGKILTPPIEGGYTAVSAYHIEYTYGNGVTHFCQSTSANNTSGGVARPDGRYHGVTFEGDDGWIFVTRGKIEASRPELLEEPLGPKALRLYASDDHMGNFFECIRSRRQPICNPYVGHKSASLCHLGTLALRLGRRLQWDPNFEKFVGDSDANQLLAREMRAPYSYSMVGEKA